MTPRFLVLLLAIAFAAGGSLRDSQATPLGTATLTWTAPGDDSLLGTASQYDIRYALEPINDENFPYATRVALLRPSPPGTQESYTVSGLLPGYDYYFAIRTSDEVGNWSRVSNLAFRPGHAITLETIATARFDLSSPWPNPVRDRVSVLLTMPYPGAATVDVFDMAGRYIQRLAGGYRGAGPVQVVWQLDDILGQRVHPGVYLLRARFEQKEIIRRMTIMR